MIKGRLLPLKSRKKSRVLKSQEKNYFRLVSFAAQKAIPRLIDFLEKVDLQFVTCVHIGPNSFLDFLKSHDSGESPGTAVPR